MTKRYAPAIPSRIVRWAAALLGAGLAAAPAAQAQAVDPAAAPAEWVRYAETATAAVTQLLQAESEPATRLRAYLEQTRPAPDQKTPPLILKLWVDGAGRVSKVDFAPFVHPEPNQDLRSLIEGATLAGAPPRDILLPMRIAVELGVPEAPATTDGAAPQG